MPLGRYKVQLAPRLPKYVLRISKYSSFVLFFTNGQLVPV